MKIIQITVGKDDDIFGLGDDNKMYMWDEHTAHWELILLKNQGNVVYSSQK